MHNKQYVMSSAAQTDVISRNNKQTLGNYKQLKIT